MTKTQQLNTLATTVVQGMTLVMATGGMSEFVAASMAAMGKEDLKMGAEQKLKILNERIRKIGFVLADARKSVISLRENRVRLMKEYGIGVSPSLVELKKYPLLRNTEMRLKWEEQELDKIELRDTLLKNQRKELETQLGRMAKEEEPRRQYPSMRKFQEPTGGIY